MNIVDQVTSFDIKVNVDGGGPKGQAEAIRLAISRALCEVDAENRPPLKKEGFLTRDPRMVERRSRVEEKQKIFPVLETLIGIYFKIIYV